MTGEQTPSGEKVHVVFKTDLDIGFTDLAANVVDEYLTTFILKALPLSERMQGEDGQSKFIWTVGSWLPFRKCLFEGLATAQN
ncbi:MAG TPA: hypothetical protein DEA91_17695 [Paenibacillus sp.]|nr:hypothetical protein [Paenibacillus sp.]